MLHDVTHCYTLLHIVTHCYSPCQCLADWQYLESRQLADSIFECGCCKLGAQPKLGAIVCFEMCPKCASCTAF